MDNQIAEIPEEEVTDQERAAKVADLELDAEIRNLKLPELLLGRCSVFCVGFCGAKPFFTLCLRARTRPHFSWSLLATVITPYWLTPY